MHLYTGLHSTILTGRLAVTAKPNCCMLLKFSFSSMVAVFSVSRFNSSVTYNVGMHACGGVVVEIIV